MLRVSLRHYRDYRVMGLNIRLKEVAVRLDGSKPPLVCQPHALPHEQSDTYCATVYVDLPTLLGNAPAVDTDASGNRVKLEVELSLEALNGRRQFSL